MATGFEIAVREKPRNGDLLLHPEVFTEEEEGSITVEDEQRIAILVLLCSFDFFFRIRSCYDEDNAMGRESRPVTSNTQLTYPRVYVNRL